jgi:alpha-glucosidase (family GH31 glycosyl hydrolase)
MIALGAEGGGLDLFVIAAPTLAELTCRFQRLVGPMPLPPLWALGYHQCRWGYRSADDLREPETPVCRERNSRRRPVAGHRLHGWIPGVHAG